LLLRLLLCYRLLVEARVVKRGGGGGCWSCALHCRCFCLACDALLHLLAPVILLLQLHLGCRAGAPQSHGLLFFQALIDLRALRGSWKVASAICKPQSRLFGGKQRIECLAGLFPVRCNRRRRVLHVSKINCGRCQARTRVGAELEEEEGRACAMHSEVLPMGALEHTCLLKQFKKRNSPILGSS
jgi:hypothetical protein